MDRISFARRSRVVGLVSGIVLLIPNIGQTLRDILILMIYIVGIGLAVLATYWALKGEPPPPKGPSPVLPQGPPPGPPSYPPGILFIPEVYQSVLRAEAIVAIVMCVAIVLNVILAVVSFLFPTLAPLAAASGLLFLIVVNFTAGLLVRRAYAVPTGRLQPM